MLIEHQPVHPSGRPPPVQFRDCLDQISRPVSRQLVPLTASASTPLKGKADTGAVSALPALEHHKPWDAMQVQKKAYKLSGVAVGV